MKSTLEKAQVMREAAEAVHSVLEEVKRITHNKHNDAVVIQQEIDTLLSQYQEPTKEQSDGQPTTT